ncbi:hypothetical protein TB2_045529 [Malus domestica]|nr:glutamate receptor 3.7-like [Malus domestica]
MQQDGLASSELNVYGLYAYDTVWVVAHSIENFMNENRNISFSVLDKLLDMRPSQIQLGKLKVFDGGSLLRENWEIADNEKSLRIGVPKRVSFVDFVTERNNSHKIEGYCIDVFNEALKLVPYDVPYRVEPFGDGQSNPSYDELVKMVAENVFDAAVGDIAIVKNRTMIVDFSQPYVITGLVIVLRA